VAEDLLIALARAYRVGTRYEDWQGRDTPVGRDTIVAVLRALGVDASSDKAVQAELERLQEEERTRLLPPVVVHRIPAGTATTGLAAGTEPAVELADGTWLEVADGRLPDGVPLGWHRLHARRGSHEQSAALMVAPARLGETPRTWGLMTQLYSVRSRGSWGLGDLHDLADLARWSASELNAGFVLINPMHATEPAPPVSPSPYSPMSRRFGSPLYLRIEDVPEYAALGPADRAAIDAMAARLQPRNETLDPLDRDAVWAAKRAALEILHGQPRSGARQQAFEAFQRRAGEPLTAFATWCALAEEHGTDWRRWPAALQDAGSGAVAAARRRLRDKVDFHCWLQWQLDEQLATTQAAARNAGMPLGIIHDLAVGVSHGSADAWAYRNMFAQGMSVGAPPDEFNQRGQDWGQPPWHPQRLAAAEYGPYRDLLAAALRHGGGLRLDHAMQVSRLWWVPEGGSPDAGTYVWYDRNALLSCLALEATLAGAVVVGEDLGTVEPELREDLAGRDILGTSLLWFERDAQGRPRPPASWREQSLATVGTHDMPPITGFLHGDHIELRDRLGLLTRKPAEELAEHRRQLHDWLTLLEQEGLLPPGAPAAVLTALDEGRTDLDTEVVAALHAFLARTPARLRGVALADAVGERRTQNQPGTVDEYPNWRVPLADAAGRPVLLEDVFTSPDVRASIGRR
jgi:4-alpha-glucanotransferase